MRKTSSAIRSKVVDLLNRHFSGNTFHYRQLIDIYVPILADTAFIVLMSILNTAMISSSGVAAVSAVSMVDSFNMFIVSLFVALATGGTVLVAQYKGSGNPRMASSTASQVVSVATLFGAVISALLLVFHGPLLQWLFGQAEADVLENARIFLVGNCVTFPLFAMYQAIIGVLRGVAETKASLILSIILNVAYFICNVFFVLLLDMGVIGLVISLLVSRTLGTAIAFGYLLKYSPSLQLRIRDSLKLNFAMVGKILHIGIPFASESLFFNGGKLLIQTFIVQFGTLALTANAIGNSLAMLFQTGPNALSIAIVTVVGQCVGRNDIPDARKFIKSFLWLSSALFVLMAAIILPLFPYLVALYSPPDEIVSEIFALVVLISVAQPLLWPISFVLPAALRAAGDARFTSLTAMLTMWLCRVVLGYILGVELDYGLIGTWLAMVIEWGIRGLLFLWRFKGEKWVHRLV